jgi:restriction alleviation protein Lar
METAVMSRFDTRNVIPGSELTRMFGRRVLPCPFCGSENVGAFAAGPTPHVTCLGCGADGPLPEPLRSRDHRDRALAYSVHLWNARAG